MALHDPVVIYHAANNIEANLFKIKLLVAGIEAHVVEDDSMIGVTIWGNGLMSQLHRPKVWIDRAYTEQAAAILEEYERQARESATGASTGEVPAKEWIDLLCESCGETASFPREWLGEDQRCPHCDEMLG